MAIVATALTKHDERGLKEARQRLANDVPYSEGLTLDQAAEESGYSKRTIREQVARGKIPNAGKHGRPRIRRADVPRKARPTSDQFNPEAEARRVVAGS